MPIVDSPIIAHRGASAIAPENTLVAVERAAGLGATWIETDVRITADGGLVMIHDSTLDRTTSGSGGVAFTPLAEILDLDAGAWFGEEFAGTRVPELNEFLHCVLDCNIGLQLELKDNFGREEELVAKTIEALRAEWPIGDRPIIVSGFSERCMRLCAEQLPEVPRAIATEFVPHDVPKRLRETQCQIIHFQADCVAEEDCDTLRQSNVEFAVATINEPEVARRFLAAGAASVLSDDPTLLHP